MLSKRQWLILDGLADQDEPLESVYFAYCEGDRSIDPAEMLADLFELDRLGLVSFRQEPIRALGQALQSREIEPDEPEAILGDCGEQFVEFRRRRDHLGSLDLGGASGVPFGIWVDRTARGREEWGRVEYVAYHA